MKNQIFVFIILLLSTRLLSQEEVKLKDGKIIIIYPNETWKNKPKISIDRPLTDTRDGHVYKIVTIESQKWMAENLKATKYSNGDKIPNINSKDQWSNLNTGAYCSYDNNTSVSNTYGYLYNWYAVVDKRNICPSGWHIPNNEEWKTLINLYGGNDLVGIKITESGSDHWNLLKDRLTGETTLNKADNSSGFTGLPSGRRSNFGEFGGLGFGSGWWSSSENFKGSAFCFYYYDYEGPNMMELGYTNETEGFPVRCIKN